MLSAVLDAWKAQPRERGRWLQAPWLELSCKHRRSCIEIRGAVGRACGWAGETEGRMGLLRRKGGGTGGLGRPCQAPTSSSKGARV